ncbi:restriction endonuclease subunit S [Nitrosomonas communis]|uniref:restriction endonuclease subunit S n=1 Tax=Nitrosomonas communis TaxID=44574 RepID=UPI0026EC4F94|nr:restriction endonuclease subunit S [Nitrosomonas communis]MCO6426962.1 restriction endonuclease subunit S [Nitrosomonas communis]
MSAWEIRKLTDLAEYVNGYAFAPEDWGTEGLPIIRIEQLKNPNAPVDYYVGKLPQKNIIDDEDLIFSWSASLFLRIWKNGKAVLNQHLFKVVEKEGVDREFLKSFIEFYLPELIKASHGSTMQHITRKELEKFSARFPIDEAEQKGVASVIAAVDRAIEQTEALIAKQQRIKIGLMQDLLTKGIDEHGNIRSEATHAFKDSPLGRIPVEWEVAPLAEAADLRVGYAFKSSWFSEDGVRLLRGENVGTGTLDWKDTACLPLEIADDFEDYRLIAGDLVIGMDRTFTKQGFKVSAVTEDDLPCLLVQRVGCFIPIGIPKQFMRFLILSPQYQRELLLQQKGMDIPHLSKSEILAPLVLLPKNEKEMTEISKRVEAMECFVKNCRDSLRKYNALKRGLMHDLLTGERRVTPLLAQPTS